MSNNTNPELVKDFILNNFHLYPKLLVGKIKIWIFNQSGRLVLIMSILKLKRKSIFKSRIVLVTRLLWGEVCIKLIFKT